MQISNRCHLIRETFKDKSDCDEELHTNDTKNRKNFLFPCFVLPFIWFPEKKEFQNIVLALAKKTISKWMKTNCS